MIFTLLADATVATAYLGYETTKVLLSGTYYLVTYFWPNKKEKPLKITIRSEKDNVGQLREEIMDLKKQLGLEVVEDDSDDWQIIEMN